MVGGPGDLGGAMTTLRRALELCVRPAHARRILAALAASAVNVCMGGPRGDVP